MVVALEESLAVNADEELSEESNKGIGESREGKLSSSFLPALIHPVVLVDI